ncbi:unnamed protein product, partial [Brugia pahangi]|uniref:T5orf172 domain-containing protein n=1 Tax=Brugia pahangi TaxID=6280 RepID=A0A0N4TJ66_BRUPA
TYIYIYIYRKILVKCLPKSKYQIDKIKNHSQYDLQHCICLKIIPKCDCNKINKVELTAHQQLDQFYQADSLVITSTTTKTIATISQQPEQQQQQQYYEQHQQEQQLSIGIPICLQRCMKKQYFTLSTILSKHV